MLTQTRETNLGRNIASGEGQEREETLKGRGKRGDARGWGKNLGTVNISRFDSWRAVSSRMLILVLSPEHLTARKYFRQNFSI